MVALFQIWLNHEMQTKYLIFQNQGAIGDYGIHKVKTILSFIIEDEKVKNLNIIEFPRTRN